MATVAEAAAQLGVSEKTIRRYVKAGKLPATMIDGPYGPQWTIPDAAITTAQVVTDVITVERPADPRLLGLAIAEVQVAQHRTLVDSLDAIRRDVAGMQQAIPTVVEAVVAALDERDQKIITLHAELAQLAAQVAELSTLVAQRAALSTPATSRTTPWWRFW